MFCSHPTPPTSFLIPHPPKPIPFLSLPSLGYKLAAKEQ